LCGVVCVLFSFGGESSALGVKFHRYRALKNRRLCESHYSEKPCLHCSNIKVYFDGDELDVATTSDEDAWLLSFNYLHSTHPVRISLATNAITTTFLAIDYWMWIGAVIIIVVIGAGLLVYFKKRNH
jgi:hypothetical protein